MKSYKIVLLIITLYIQLSCTDNDLKNVARQKSDTLINNIGKTDAIKYFSEKYFSRDELVPILNDLGFNCDFEHRKGKFVDYFYESTPGPDKVNFIYEYYLQCDSLRFILGYKLENDPELIWFKIEPIEIENKMIIDKSKQLLH